MTYTLHRSTQETLTVLDRVDIDADKTSEEELYKKFGLIDEFHDNELTVLQKYRPRIWQALEEPYSSNFAKINGYMSVFFVLLSLITFCFKSIPDFVVVELVTVSIPPLYWTITSMPGVNPHIIFFYLELICNVYFTFELIFRLFATPRLNVFIKSTINIIDSIALFNFYFYLFLYYFQSPIRFNIWFETFGVVRLLRVFKLTRHISGLKILILTFQASFKELLLLLFFLFVFIVVFAAFIYYAERLQTNDNNQFKSIIDGLWWAIITMTTVGYGDFVPKTIPGMIVGALCAVTGVLTISLPIPVIVSNFSMFYSHTQARSKLPKQRRRVLPVEAVRPKGKGPQNVGPVKKHNQIAAMQIIDRSTKVDYNAQKPNNNGLNMKAPRKSTQLTGKLFSKAMMKMDEDMDESLE